MNFTDRSRSSHTELPGVKNHYRQLFIKLKRVQFVLPIFLLLLTSCATNATHNISTSPVRQTPRASAMLNGKTASLSWIYGRDCSRGVQAYLRTARADPDVALVGTGWVNPTNGGLINGHNNCVPGSPSMDGVVRLIHSKGGMAYLTITMDTEGPDPWTVQQAAAYVGKATTDQGYIDVLMREVIRAGYDGAIMDLEGVDHAYPAIQHVFAEYNRRVWTALKSLHKWYGIALIPRTSDAAINDYNAFEDWRLLARSADFVVIMAVDGSYYTPGPAVNLAWLKHLLAYARQTMPQMVPHIIWELPLYGDIWHWEDGGWIFDSPITFQSAQALVRQASRARIDGNASNLQDPFAPHLVYTDVSGVKHALWYPTGKSLYAIISGFWQVLKKEPGIVGGHLQIAVWWRTTQEPPDFWPLLDSLYREKFIPHKFTEPAPPGDDLL